MRSLIAIPVPAVSFNDPFWPWRERTPLFVIVVPFMVIPDPLLRVMSPACPCIVSTPVFVNCVP